MMQLIKSIPRERAHKGRLGTKGIGESCANVAPSFIAPRIASRSIERVTTQPRRKCRKCRFTAIKRSSADAKSRLLFQANKLRVGEARGE